MEILLFSFQHEFLYFFFLPNTLVWTSNIVLSKNGEAGHPHPCLFLMLEEKLAALHCWVWWKLWVCYYGLCYLELHSLSRVLIINGCWLLSNGFFCIYWGNHKICIFCFVNVVYHIDLQRIIPVDLVCLWEEVGSESPYTIILDNVKYFSSQPLALLL